MAETLDAVPARVKALIALFDEELKGLKFPDVDRAVLDAHTAEVRARAADVAKVETSLRAAQEALEAAQERLNAKAYRAQGYARVFAEGNDALVDKLDALALSKTRTNRSTPPTPAATSTEPKKRGRPAKTTPPTNLFGGPAETTPVLEHAVVLDDASDAIDARAAE